MSGTLYIQFCGLFEILPYEIQLSDITKTTIPPQIGQVEVAGKRPEGHNLWPWLHPVSIK